MELYLCYISSMSWSAISPHLNLTCVCLCVVVIRGEENQLDATQWFIELVICSACFRHLYAHHQELETILLLQRVACSAVKMKSDSYPFNITHLTRI
jgi:hypothetical protein